MLPLQSQVKHQCLQSPKRPPASSGLVCFGMSVRREFSLPGSRTVCAEYRYSLCLPILHKQHDAPRGVNTHWRIKTFPAKMSLPPLYQVQVHRTCNCRVANRCGHADLMQTWRVNRLFSLHTPQMETRLLRICLIEKCRWFFIISGCFNRWNSNIFFSFRGCCSQRWQVSKTHNATMQNLDFSPTSSLWGLQMPVSTGTSSEVC